MKNGNRGFALEIDKAGTFRLLQWNSQAGAWERSAGKFPTIAAAREEAASRGRAEHAVSLCESVNCGYVSMETGLRRGSANTLFRQQSARNLPQKGGEGGPNRLESSTG